MGGGSDAADAEFVVISASVVVAGSAVVVCAFLERQVTVRSVLRAHEAAHRRVRRCARGAAERLRGQHARV